MTATTLEAQYGEAIDQIQAEGIHVSLNVMTCCRGCTLNEDLGIEEGEELYAWTFGGQGNELVWEGGKPFFQEEEIEEECSCEEEVVEEGEDGEEYIVSEAYTCDACNGYSSQARETRPADYQYFYFGALEAAEVTARAFRAHGFTVEWDGSRTSAVKVIF